MESVGELVHIVRTAVGAFFILICIVYAVLRLTLGKEKAEELYAKGDRPIRGSRK